MSLIIRPVSRSGSANILSYQHSKMVKLPLLLKFPARSVYCRDISLAVYIICNNYITKISAANQCITNPYLFKEALGAPTRVVEQGRLWGELVPLVTFQGLGGVVSIF